MGSASKGRGGYYHYYHCSVVCKCRFKAEVVNDAFVKEVNRIYVRDGYEPFYHHVFSKAFNLKSNNGAYNRKQILQEIKDQNFKIEQARDFMISGEFTNVDFQAVKKEAEKRITMLEAKLPDLAFTYKNVDMILTGALSNLKKLSTVYKSDSLRKKQAIIGSIYPENLMFDGFIHRTTRPSDVVQGILLINKKLGPKKNWTESELTDLSSVVAATIPISNHFLRDLRLIADLDL